MTKTYTRKGNGLTYSVAEAVRSSLTEDVAYSCDDSEINHLYRKIDAQADAIGHLAALLVKIAPVCAAHDVDAALAEIVSYRFTEKAAA
jgi:hypothetical protein